MRPVGLLLWLLAGGVPGTALASESLVGAWRFEGEGVVLIHPVPPAPGAAPTLRYRVVDDGRAGELYPAGEGVWESGGRWSGREPIQLRVHQASSINGRTDALLWEPVAGTARRATRLALRTERVDIPGPAGVLHAKLVLPAGEGPYPVALVLHGSENISGATHYWHAEMLAAHGIAGLIYDKRGTGRSAGSFTMDFEALADDAVAVIGWLRRQPAIDAGRVALMGYSQSGWLAPLAANRVGGIAAIVIGYGMVDSPLEEDVAQALLPLRDERFSDVDRSEADELVRAAHPILLSGLSDGWGEFAAVADKYRERRWMPALGDCIARKLIGVAPDAARAAYAPFMAFNLSWDYDSRAVLSALDIPMYWQLAGEDAEAPIAGTLAHLDAFISAGKPYAYKVYPQTDHGIVEFDEIDGKRLPTGYHRDYWRDQIGWLREKLRAL